MSGEKKGRAIVLGGKTGLLGRPLTAALTAAGFAVRPTTRSELDPFDAGAVAAALEAFEATHLFNTVAYTAVDAAEDDSEAAYRLNRDLPGLLARACGPARAVLVHYSTDFVFGGDAHVPYKEEDPTDPRSVYGASKLAGERAIQEAGLPRYQILRTAWLFGPGKKNFVATILGLARTRPELSVVADQVGSPTCTLDLAAWSAALAATDATGIFHAVGSGQASWCELAAEAVIAASLPCRVLPIPSSGYPQKAWRPRYSVLDNGKLAAAIGYAPRSWLQSLREYVYSQEQASD
ncbi:MAG: dTDP-4-dehydrorhamnose reductase [Solidesulfovibrio sp. DCME]|uniref:dTDP-4-dehydrorhamnose reductase n=1 Tax=Solidesulfovibrio sp. DCME TaxID=3447380 RepID=UPI003D1453AA